MIYILPYEILRKNFIFIDGLIEFPYDQFIEFTRYICMGIKVDEEWYSAKYADVARAIAAGSMWKNPIHHFVGAGYFDGRSPNSDIEAQPMMSFAELQKKLVIEPMRGELFIRMSEKAFRAALNGLLHAVDVDEAWYQRQYPDIQNAISEGRLKSARQHFAQVGYFEGRLPAEIEVDELWYTEFYPDLNAAKKTNATFSGSDHFARSGYREGRTPSPRVPNI